MAGSRNAAVLNAAGAIFLVAIAVACICASKFYGYWIISNNPFVDVQRTNVTGSLSSIFTRRDFSGSISILIDGNEVTYHMRTPGNSIFTKIVRPGEKTQQLEKGAPVKLELSRSKRTGYLTTVTRLQIGKLDFFYTDPAVVENQEITLGKKIINEAWVGLFISAVMLICGIILTFYAALGQPKVDTVGSAGNYLEIFFLGWFLLTATLVGMSLTDRSKGVLSRLDLGVPDNYLRAAVCVCVMLLWLPMLLAAATVRSQYEFKNGKLDVTKGSGFWFATVRMFRYVRDQNRISLVAAKTNRIQGLLSMLAPIYAIGLLAVVMLFGVYLKI
jgi:hypothetical protein